jgi:hypothetical protein
LRGDYGGIPKPPRSPYPRRPALTGLLLLIAAAALAPVVHAVGGDNARGARIAMPASVQRAATTIVDDHGPGSNPGDAGGLLIALFLASGLTLALALDRQPFGASVAERQGSASRRGPPRRSYS